MDSAEFDRNPFHTQASSAENHDLENSVQSVAACSSDSETVKPKNIRLKVKIPVIPARQDSDQRKKHFCGVCNKEFSSGKAYGGHVRIHSKEQMKKKNVIRGTVKKIQKKMKKKAKSLTISDGKIKCCLCGKEFQTMHSLFGHMRRHPGRTWKGIRPPNPPLQAAGSSSSSEKYKISSCSSVLENQADQEDDDMESSAEVTVEASEEIQEAAFSLMMLACARRNHHMKKKITSLEEQKSSGSSVDMDMISPSTDKSLMADMKIKMNMETANPRDHDYHFEDKSSITCLEMVKHAAIDPERSSAAKILEFDLNEPYIDPDQAEGGGFTFHQIYGC